MGLFSRVWEGIKRVFRKTEIEAALRVNTVQSDMMDNAIKLWSNMYCNKPPWRNKDTKTLNMPAVIAAKIAKLATIEAGITINGSARADYISRQIAPLWDKRRNIAEFAAAKGGIFFKPYINSGRVIIESIQADRCFPTSTDDDGNITGCVFIAQQTIGKLTYTRLERHEFVNGTYAISNKVYKSDDDSILGSPARLADVPEWKNIQEITYIKNLERPLFVYFKMPFANNIDPTSPLGVSIYSRAADTIKELDRQYSRLIWEFEGGELAVHASEELFRPRLDGSTQYWGRPVLELPNGKERLYRILDGQVQDKNCFEVFAPAFRDASLLNGFDNLLKQIEAQCGLAFGTLSNPQNVDKTATEIIQSKQESYSTIVDIQKALETAINRLCRSIDALATAGNLAPIGNYEVSCTWDDSIITDKEAKKTRLYQLVLSDKFPLWRYLVICEGFGEDEAKAIAEEMKSNPDLENPFHFEGVS